MPKVTMSDAKGLTQKKGSGVEIKSSDVTIRSTLTVSGTVNKMHVALTAVSCSSATKINHAGFYPLSGGAAFTVTLPKASAMGGGALTFRNVSAHAFILTGSQESNGHQVISGPVYTAAGASSVDQGSKLTFPAVANTSVHMVSDGFNWLVLNCSGTMTYAGT